MRPRTVRTAFVVAVFLMSVVAPAPGAPGRVRTSPRNVVLLIGDGFGPAQVALARGVAGRPLALDPHLVGSAATASHSSRVTDSGAAATALASGVHTANNAIGVDEQGRARTTILEAAEARGLATGLVVTARLTHATPAAFAAHVGDRSEEDAIALQMLDHGIEVMLGGGSRHFLPRDADGSRRDGRDLLAEATRAGVQVVQDRTGLRAAGPGPLLGVFDRSHVPYVLDRDTLHLPSLVEMTRVALTRLSRDPDGFFLMIEGSRIDHAAHENDAATAAREALEFDAVFEEVLAFARREGRTLVVATADHETGGLSLGREVGDRSVYDWRPELLRAARASTAAMAARVERGDDPARVLAEDAGLADAGEREIAAIRSPGAIGRQAAIGRVVSERALVGWTTRGHTAVDVPVWAWGPGAETLRGNLPNDELGRRVAGALGLRIGDPRPGAARPPGRSSDDD